MTVPKWKAERCEHCAAGVPICCSGALCAFHQRTHGELHLACTAPSEAEYIAELEAKLAAAEETIACKESFLHNFKHAVKLEREDSEKELAAAAADTRRLNWLEKMGFATTHRGNSERELGVHCWRYQAGSEQFMEWKWTAWWISSEYANCREAIDAAMKSEPVVTRVGTGAKSDV